MALVRERTACNKPSLQLQDLQVRPSLPPGRFLVYPYPGVHYSGGRPLARNQQPEEAKRAVTLLDDWEQTFVKIVPRGSNGAGTGAAAC